MVTNRCANHDMVFGLSLSLSLTVELNESKLCMKNTGEGIFPLLFGPIIGPPTRSIIDAGTKITFGIQASAFGCVFNSSSVWFFVHSAVS